MKPIFVSSLVALLIVGCGRAPDQAANRAVVGPAVRTRVVTVQPESVANITEVTGIVRPNQRAQVAAKVMGTIEDMPFVLGQRIQAGDILVKIGAAEINARRVQAQSQLNAVQRDLQRERDLLVKGASTPDMVRGLEDRFTAVQALVNEAEIMLGYATIRAPFAGVIARKLANVGDLASPGYPLLEIEGLGGFEVEAGIPDSLAAQLSVGTPLAVAIADTSGPTDRAALSSLSGSLAELSSAADPSAHTVTAKISLPAQPKVRSGQFVRVLIPGAATSTLLVPTTAVTTVGQMDRIFVATSDNRAELRLVKTGSRRGERTEILAGIDGGERIVIDAPVGLREGQRLEIEP